MTNPVISVTGPAPAEIITSTNPDEYVYRMTTEGIYYFTAQATGPDGTTYQNSLAVTVMNKNTLDTLLKQKWEGMKAALLGGNQTQALTFFVSESKDQYSTLFSNTSVAKINAIFSNANGFTIGSLHGNSAECSILRQEAGGTYSYPVRFAIGENGIWGIERF